MATPLEIFFLKCYLFIMTPTDRNKEMSNPQPSLENLKLGWGKRPKLGNKTFGMRLSEQTKQTLEDIARQYGCFHGGEPWIAGLLTKVADGELMVVPAPPPFEKAKVPPAAKSTGT